MKTIQEVSKETLKIENYLRTLDEGTCISYDEIHKQTGVRMDTKGKSYLRTAMKRCGYQYLCKPGNGVELASPESAMTITAHSLVKVDGAVRKSAKTTKSLYERFADRMEETAKKQLGYIVAFHAAIRTQSINMKRMVRERISLANYKQPEL
jgi:hypothetical protein